MRISTANRHDDTVSTLVRRQAELQEAQDRMTSGKRVSRASDDPTAAGRAERALARMQRNDANQRAVQASNIAMSLADTALGDASELMQSAREIMVKAGNGTYSDKERAALADELSGIRKQLMAVANRTDGSGQYLFAGQGSTSAPFVDTTAGVAFNGTPGSLQLAAGEALPGSVDGSQAWMTAPSGNGVFQTRPAAANTGAAWIDPGRVAQPSALLGGDYDVQFSVSGGVTTFSVLHDGNPTAIANQAYEPGKAIEIDGLSFTISGQPANGDRFAVTPSTPDMSPFKALDLAIADLKAASPNSGQLQQMASSRIGDIDAAMGRLQAVRSEVGGSLQRIESQGNQLQDAKLANQTEKSNAVDLDMVQAISDFSIRQSSYETALKAYSSVRKMSLFDYIG